MPTGRLLLASELLEPLRMQPPVAAGDAARRVAIAAAGVPALVAGEVEAGPKQVVIEPLGLTFGADDLHVRA